MELNDPIRLILENKPREVWAIAPDASVYEALQLMADKDIGALAVCEERRLVGIVAERDYARKVILLGKSSRDTVVSEIMRPPDLTVTPETTVDECMRVMTGARVRHLPVMRDSQVTAIISLGDLVNWVISAQEGTIQYLQAYVAGSYPV